MLVIHIVGPQGSGKSTLAQALTLLWQGKRQCVTVDSDTMCAEFKGEVRQAAAANPTAEVLILEHLPSMFLGADPADWVINASRGAA